MLTTILKSVDTIVIIASTSCSLTLSLTGIGLMVLPISPGRACGLAISYEVIYEIVTQKYNKHKKTIKRINKKQNLPLN